MTDRRQLANAIRALSMDAVQRANSGHPGMPMGMADIAEVLFNDFMSHNPANPDWWNRDRFVVSNGHGSMLLYSALHLSGYALSIEDLKNFRQLNSPTPGHPEYGEAPGVETTTGPLGQGLANAVGMALAEKLLARSFNRDDLALIDHYTWVFAGDGCLMEGVSHEACSLAGTWGLGKLVVFYDDNGISIDGKVEGWFTDDTPARFRSYGWQVIDDVDGHDPASIRAAVEQARADDQRPTLICCKTEIGFGSPNKHGTAGVHGSPLGDEEIAKTRAELGWTHPPFEVPDEIRAGWDGRERGAAAEHAWTETWERYRECHPGQAAEFERRMRHELPPDFDTEARRIIEAMQADGSKVATRKASGQTLEQFGPLLPELLGGSADLTGSNNTDWSGSRDILQADPVGNYIYYGVREFGMTAIASGLHLHGGFIPYTGTFLVFSDYARNAVRMSALIPTGAIHVYTGPSALILTRQGLDHQLRTGEQLDQVARGGYILSDGVGSPEIILIASGSEVGLATGAAAILNDDGIATRVVSMPNPERFMAGDAEYREHVLPSSVRGRIAIEAGVSRYWQGLVGHFGKVIGIDRFGASAPAAELFEQFGLTVDNVVSEARNLARHDR
ncbi:MAG: transketolase [Xanthomonadaceae bacterium]|nr:transketolase [Xanthomonadaceae bacterium]